VDALGASDLIVGVDKFSVIPESVQHLPKVGDFLSPNLEAMLALHPDIIFLDAVQTNVETGLIQTGIRVFSVKMQTVDDVTNALRTAGDALGRPDAAARVIQALRARLDDESARATAAAARAGHRPRVLFVVDRRPGGLAGMVAAGPGTYIDELLHRAGADNALGDASARYVQLAAEEVIRRAPDVIFDAAHDVTEHGAADWAPLASVPAVARGRVYLLSSTMYVTPGPRLGDALAGLVGFLWGP
jgi:iron complex transport system substrate-binding protein